MFGPRLLFLAAALAILPVAHARAPGDARWIGKPITLKATDADLADLLRLIAEASGFNIVLGDGVQGKMRAISWVDVPWDQALDAILKTKHLHAERSGNLLRIVTHDEYMREGPQPLAAPKTKS